MIIGYKWVIDIIYGCINLDANSQSDALGSGGLESIISNPIIAYFNSMVHYYLREE